MKRLTLLAVVVLVVAACGGGSGGDSTVSTASGGTETTAAAGTDITAAPSPDDTDPAATTTAPPDDGGGAVEGAGIGTATIAGVTYEFGDLGRPGLQCMPSSFGVAFLAALDATDGRGGAIVVGIPFEGEEDTAGILPELGVSGDDLEWMANEARAAEQGIPAGSSQVDSYEINGNTISGSATFVEVNSTYGASAADFVVETGTFEVTCAGS